MTEQLSVLIRVVDDRALQSVVKNRGMTVKIIGQNSFRRWLPAPLLTFALAVMLPGSALAALTPPTVPANLQVPAGNAPYLVGHAVGVQIYSCKASGAGFAWTFVAPEATLSDDAGTPIATHFAGPTWKATDGSTVKGMSIANAPSPTGNAIPWLLLRATSTAAGPGGGTTLTGTSFVQRVNTMGGVAPTSGCDATHVDATARVDYTANYYFYSSLALPKTGGSALPASWLVLGGLAIVGLGVALRRGRGAKNQNF